MNIRKERNQKQSKGRNNGKRGALLLILSVFLFSLSGCLDLDEEEEPYAESGWEEDGFQENLEDETPTYDADVLGIEGKSVSIEGLREHYVNTQDAQDVVVMVYMIGSDLESEDGSASADLYEMMDADLGDHLQIVIETGGAAQWEMDGISSDENELWLIDKDEVRSLGTAEYCSMTETENLSNFISWSAETVPADRYILLLWDHGGGTMNGFGYDENFESPSLSLVDLSDALEATDVKFDLIGFDACLMGTIETAYAMEPYADYLIASEEYVPGDGWYYTDWLSLLGENPSVSTIELGKQIIDDFAYFYDNEEVTLSLIELREIPYLYENMGAFLANARSSIEEDNSNFNVLSKARSNAREYCNGEIDQVDISDLIRRTQFEGKEEMLQALTSCIKYRNNSSLTGSYGLAMYFPYREMEDYSDTLEVLDGIGFHDPTEFYNYFLSIMAGRQRQTDTGNQGGLLHKPEEDYSFESWYDDTWEEFSYEGDYEELYLEETEEGYALILSEEEWDLITDIQLAVMEEYEEGYLDLGYDNVGSITEEGDLLIDYGDTWISLDGIPVAFYANKIEEEGDSTIFSGSVYATLNGIIPIEMVLEWEPMTDELAELGDYELQGFVKGYRIIEDHTDTKPKGLKTLKQGDRISLEYDYYDEEGNYIDTVYPYQDIVVRSQEALQVSYADISDRSTICWGILIDIYQQEMYTETLEFSAGSY